jgi:hypothetical protein
MLPMPCAHKEPSQHFTLYFNSSLHKQPLLLERGDVKDAVLFFKLSVIVFGVAIGLLMQLLII